ncbi:MAG: hypothetical protein HY934_07300, partial [Candidatus Firestonebacteria bacterium]|nr:hypothetical protein [Candidatus Firestonebacteria bacterium]
THDATLFPTAMSKLIERYHKLIKEAGKIKITFDKGNNSKENIKLISETEKDHRIISLHPIWHWTDSKIRIDAFISVLAYFLI